MNPLSLQMILDALTSAILHSLWQVALIGAAAAIGLSVLRRAKPQSRYAVCAGAMVLMLGLPALTFVASLDAVRSDAAILLLSSSETGVAEGATIEHTATATPPFVFDWDSTGSSWLAIAWFVGFAFCLIRFALHWHFAARLKRDSVTTLSNDWSSAVSTLATRLRIRRPIRVVQSAAVQVPAVVGWLLPMVLIPAGSAAQLTPAQWRAVLAHELAHVSRHDVVINIVQALIESLLFYHPAVWWVSKRMRLERECCCDDVAVQACGEDALQYAHALASLEEWRQDVTPTLALSATGGSLMYRIQRLAGIDARRGNSSKWIAPAIAALSLSTGAWAMAAASPAPTAETEQAAPPARQTDRRLPADARPLDASREHEFRARLEEMRRRLEALRGQLEERHEQLKRGAAERDFRPPSDRPGLQGDWRAPELMRRGPLMDRRGHGADRAAPAPMPRGGMSDRAAPPGARRAPGTGGMAPPMDQRGPQTDRPAPQSDRPAVSPERLRMLAERLHAAGVQNPREVIRRLLQNPHNQQLRQRIQSVLRESEAKRGSSDRAPNQWQQPKRGQQPGAPSRLGEPRESGDRAAPPPNDLRPADRPQWRPGAGRAAPPPQRGGDRGRGAEVGDSVEGTPPI